MAGSWRWAVVAFCFVMVCVAAGCGRKAEKTPAAKATPPAGVGLPDWAPKNPSPEFLRAAKVLKPLPEDAGGGGSPLAVAFYEMFGVLTDEQIATFLERKQVNLPPDAPADTRALFKGKYGAREVGGELVYSRNKVSVPVKSLTPAQRRAFEKVKAAMSDDFKAQGDDDLLVQLYRIGAKEDLSNVDVAFTATGHEVHFRLTVMTKKSANRITMSGFGRSFAQL